MKIEISLRDEEVKEAVQFYLDEKLNLGGNFKVTDFYPSMGKVTLEDKEIIEDTKTIGVPDEEITIKEVENAFREEYKKRKGH